MENILKVSGFVIVGLIAIKFLFFALGILSIGFFIVKLAVIGIVTYLPALAGAIVTSKGLSEIGVVGFRKGGTDIPVTIDDKWHLGSETKAMPAALIGSLVEQNKLKWDSTLGQIFPEQAESMTPQVRSITVEQLFLHRSGLPANLSWPAIAQTGSVSEQRKQVLNLISELKIENEPDRFEHSCASAVSASLEPS